MDILIRCLQSFFSPGGIIQTRRVLPTKTLRAHFLGLTLAFVGAFLTIVLDYHLLFKGLFGYAPIVATGIFLFGTYVGGLFVMISAGIFFVTDLQQPITPPTFFPSLMIIAGWYFIFYMMGMVFTTLYNFLVFLSMSTFGKKDVKIIFAYDPKKKINIIKSPIDSEELAWNKLITKKPVLKERKYYHFELKTPPAHPYTIAFVANPKIFQRKRNAPDSYSYLYDPDPIMKELDHFLRTVNYALYSFEQDEIIGRPEIWSRVRVVTIFDNENDTTRSDDDLSLVQTFQEDIKSDNEAAENLIYPRARMVENVNRMLQRYQSDIPIHLTTKLIDVIFALTASPTHIRHTAYYSDFNESGSGPLQPSSEGTNFIYDPDPYNNKGTSINVPRCGEQPFACQHDDYAAFPGRVALNVLSARRHTFVHEFAHAMSSAVRGAICDEYYDKSFLASKNLEVFIPFYVNRIERTQKHDGQFVPIHQVFAKYNDEVFTSDLTHPSAETEWLSYFPEREHGVYCTMDRYNFPFGFDKLISRFMYDRLTSKLNRQKEPFS